MDLTLGMAKYCLKTFLRGLGCFGEGHIYLFLHFVKLENKYLFEIEEGGVIFFSMMGSLPHFWLLHKSLGYGQIRSHPKFHFPRKRFCYLPWWVVGSVAGWLWVILII